jgi:hypothetical protein
MLIWTKKNRRGWLGVEIVSLWRRVVNDEREGNGQRAKRRNKKAKNQQYTGGVEPTVFA